MSRRIEITVPNDWALPVRDCLEDPLRCNLSDRLEKPCMIVEMAGRKNTVFLVTVPGPIVSPTLECLRKNGIGTTVGRIILSSIDFLKPELSKPLTKPDVTIQSMKDVEAEPLPGAVSTKKAAPLKGFQHFQKARKTTEEMYNDISNGASMNINTWMNLIGASVMAAGGLVTNVTVFIVAAMLVSPIMGPILGMTFGYRVSDWPLFRTGFINEVKMAFSTYFVGCFVGLILGGVGNTYKWPNSAMMPEGQAFNLIISIVVSAAAGMVLGVALTSTGGNALVGTAISAGLLPPLVNAGMLQAYAFVYAPKDLRDTLYELGMYSILFYMTHVITIVFVANFVFYLKDVDPRFKDGDDSNFNDIPSLVEHKRRLEEVGKEYTERDKAEFFIGHIKDDLTDFTHGLKDKATDLVGKASNVTNIITGGLIGKRTADQHQQSVHSKVSQNDMYGTDSSELDLESGGGDGGSGKNSNKSLFFNSSVKNPVRRSSNASASSSGSGRVKTSSGVEMTSMAGSSQSYVRIQLDTHDDHPDNSEVVNPMQVPLAPIVPASPGRSSLKSPNKDTDKKHKPAREKSVSISSEDNIEEQAALQQKIFDFYSTHNPDKLSSVPGILEKYRDREGELLVKLRKQYNVDV